MKRALLARAKTEIEAGADPNTGRIHDHWNINPLGHAIKVRNKPMVKLLLGAGADISLLDTDYRARLVKLMPNAPALIEAAAAAKQAPPVAKKKPA